MKWFLKGWGLRVRNTNRKIRESKNYRMIQESYYWAYTLRKPQFKKTHAYGFRKCSNFILLHLVFQFSQHHLLKRLSFPHCILRMDSRPEYKTRNYKTLRRKHRWNIQWHKSKQDPYDPPPRVTEIKTKSSKWDLIKLKSFFTAKETIGKMKRQPTELEKLIANETVDKWLISKYTSSSYSSKPEKQTQSKSGKKT